MIERIHLENFKASRNLNVRLAPLSLLAGLNSSGKSSILQALAMLRQDRTGALLRLRWLTVTPGSLLGLLLTYLALGDTWATLLFGCFSTGLGALLCDLWAPVPPGAREM